MSLYQDLQARGIETDNHESDLYVPVTDETYAMVRDSGLRWTVFTSEVDGRRWFDIFGAFDPFWEARRAR